MLVLSRKKGERVFLEVMGERIEVILIAIEPGRVRLGFDAPVWVKIARAELMPKEPSHDETVRD
jgi:carbon storage regulator CsrA